MERNYLEDFPIDDTEHKIVGGKSDYVNKFFHEIDLKYILERLDQVSADDISLTNDGLSVQLLLNGEVKSTINLSQPVNGAIDEAKTALQHEIDLVKGRVTVLEASMGAAESDIDDLQANVNGFRYFPAGTKLVGLVADDSIYTDENGLYVLADSTTGATLLADSTTYKQVDSVEDTHGKVGADTCSPFNGGGGDSGYNLWWRPSEKDFMLAIGSSCRAGCTAKIVKYMGRDNKGENCAVVMKGHTNYQGSGSSNFYMNKTIMAYVKVDLSKFNYFCMRTQRNSSSGRMYAFISRTDPKDRGWFESTGVGIGSPNNEWCNYFSDTANWNYFESGMNSEWTGEAYVGIAISANDANAGTVLYDFEFFNYKPVAEILSL